MIQSLLVSADGNEVTLLKLSSSVPSVLLSSLQRAAQDCTYIEDTHREHTLHILASLHTPPPHMIRKKKKNNTASNSLMSSNVFTKPWVILDDTVFSDPPSDGFVHSAALRLHIYSNAGRPWHYPQCMKAESVITTPIQTDLAHRWCSKRWGRGKRHGGVGERWEERGGQGWYTSVEKFTLNLDLRERLGFTSFPN